jgi:putative DNA primase/helicase
MIAPVRVPLRDRTRGQWHSILTGLGIDARYLTRKNTACPLCRAGTDRFRFIDNNGDGTWICNQCGTGSGSDLAIKFTGLPFREVAPRIEELIGEAPTIHEHPRRNEANIRFGLRRLWAGSTPVHRGDHVDKWLRFRRIELDLFPSCLRTAARIPYYDDRFTHWPAMLALVAAPDGTASTIHRTYLTKEGFRAPVGKPRKVFSPPTKGSAVRLSPPAPMLGIAEGIESALSAAKLFGVPVWAGLCASGIQNFEPPDGTRELIVFADNDANGVGQRAAEAIAARLSDRISVSVRIPDRPDSDWNDDLVRGTSS